MHGGTTAPSGELQLQVIRAGEAATPAEIIEYPTYTTMNAMRRFWMPQDGLPEVVNQWRTKNMRNIFRGAWRAAAARKLNIPFHMGTLWLTVITGEGEVIPYGLASTRMVTTAGATKIVDFLRANDVTTGQNFKYHAIGTGVTGEAIGDTALVTELTTQYNPDSTRATGSQTNNGATVYRTVGTNTVDASASVAEHGIMSQAATGGGSLLDRSQFTAVALANGDSLQSTYDFTVTTGG